MFAGPFKDGMFGGFVVTKLDVWCGENGSKQDWCNNGSPSLEKIDKGLGAGKLLEEIRRYVSAGHHRGLLG